MSSMRRSSPARRLSSSRITGSMPRSIVSTTSAWCSASRAAQVIASEGVASATGSRWRGLPLRDGSSLGAGNSRSVSLAIGAVNAMNAAAMPMLNTRCQATTACTLACWSAEIHGRISGISGAAIATPISLNRKLPSGTRRARGVDRSVESIASSPLPMFAPSTIPSAACSGTSPESAIVAVSSTIARLE